MYQIEAKVKQLLLDENIIQDTDCFDALTGGQTNYVWKISGSQNLVCKLYSESSQNPLYENAPVSEYLCLQHLEGMDLAPKSRAFIEASIGVILVYDYLDGRDWHNNVSNVAQLLGRVHSVSAPAGLRKLSIGSDALYLQVEAMLEQLNGNARNELVKLKPDTNEAPIGTVCLVHTDVVPANIIHTKNGLNLIDWQCPGIGDPIEDLAMFLSPAMQHIYRGKTLTKDERHQFLDAYDDQEVSERYKRMASIYHWRMAAYCAWKADRGSVDYDVAKHLEIDILKQIS